MVKVATFFLLAIVVIALVSQWFRPPPPPPRTGRFCPYCGKPRLGKAPCDCGGRG